MSKERKKELPHNASNKRIFNFRFSALILFRFFIFVFVSFPLVLILFRFNIFVFSFRFLFWGNRQLDRRYKTNSTFSTDCFFAWNNKERYFRSCQLIDLSYFLTFYSILILIVGLASQTWVYCSICAICWTFYFLGYALCTRVHGNNIF